MDAVKIKTDQSKKRLFLDFDWLKDENERTIERAYNLARLSAMCELEMGWDGNEAKPISKDLITYVSGLLFHVAKQPELYPTSDGGIQIQYEKPDRTYLEIVFSPGSIIGMRVQNGNPETAEFTDFDYGSDEAIEEYIGDFNEA